MSQRRHCGRVTRHHNRRFARDAPVADIICSVLLDRLHGFGCGGHSKRHKPAARNCALVASCGNACGPGPHTMKDVANRQAVHNSNADWQATGPPPPSPKAHTRRTPAPVRSCLSIPRCVPPGSQIIPAPWTAVCSCWCDPNLVPLLQASGV